MRRFYSMPVLAAWVLCPPAAAPAQDKAPPDKGGKEKLALDITLSEVFTPKGRELVVRTVTERGGGYRMGLVPGDIILGINGYKVDTVDKLREHLYNGEVTLCWRSKSGAFYRNSIWFESPPTSGGPDGPPAPAPAGRRVRIGDLVEGKTLQEVEPPPRPAPPPVGKTTPP